MQILNVHVSRSIIKIPQKFVSLVIIHVLLAKEQTYVILVVRQIIDLALMVQINVLVCLNSMKLLMQLFAVLVIIHVKHVLLEEQQIIVIRANQIGY